MNANAFFGYGLMQAAEKIAREMKNSDGRTNPNSKPAKQGKNAKSKKQMQREADLEMQRQMQLDQQKFLQENIFDRTGATRRDISGQIERNVPKGMDYFKNTGPDRPELVDRQNRLNNQGLKNPWFEANAREAVDLARRKQSEPSLFGTPQQPSQDQLLRQNTSTMDVFDNPANNQTNPRTGLVTNDGPFVRSRPNPYGTARALFEPQKQQPAQQPVPGPVQNLFQGGFQNYNQAVNDALQETAPQNTMPYRPINDAQAVFTPQAGLTPPSPMNEAPSAVNPAVLFGAPNITWGDIIPQGPSEPLFDLFDRNPQTGNEQIAWQRLFDIFTPNPQDYQQPANNQTPFQFAPML